MLKQSERELLEGDLFDLVDVAVMELVLKVSVLQDLPATEQALKESARTLKVMRRLALLIDTFEVVLTNWRGRYQVYSAQRLWCMITRTCDVVLAHNLRGSETL